MKAVDILALVPAGTGPVEVIGEGAFADDLRERLGDRGAPGPGKRPCAIIDTVGEATALAAALKDVDDLGTIILAGPAPAGPVSIDLYSDLHVRGLTIICAP